MARSGVKMFLYLLLGLVILAALYVGIPLILLYKADMTMSEDPCAAGDRHSEAAPTNALFDALDLADVAGYFPGFEESAEDLAVAGTSVCLGKLANACNGVRFAAEGKAREALRARRDEAHAKAKTPKERRAVAESSAAEELDLDWQSEVSDETRARFCGDWKRWLEWLEAAQVDSDAVCAVCKDDS